MKIVHVITRLILGGAQENTLYTCEGLHERGHDVTLITGPSLGPEGALLERARQGGYQLVEVPDLVRQINPFIDVPAYYRLCRLIKELAPDIVHTHSAKAGVLGRWAADKVRKDASDCCCGTLRKMREANMQHCRRPQIVHTIHGLAFHPYLPAWKNRLYITVERNAAKSTDAFITVAQAMTDQALEVGIGRPEQYTRVFSGLEVEPFVTDPSSEQIVRERAQLDIPADAIVIVTVARLAEFKGHEYVIEAAKALAPSYPNVYWLFVGDGHQRAQVERDIAQAGLSDRFRLTGLVSPERIPELIHASDILVHCSLREGLARVLPQALLCAKPAVCFDLDGAREVVINDQTGFLLPPRALPPLVDALRQLIENQDLRVRLGRQGREHCRKPFDHRVMVEQIENVYHTLL